MSTYVNDRGESEEEEDGVDVGWWNWKTHSDDHREINTDDIALESIQQTETLKKLYFEFRDAGLDINESLILVHLTVLSNLWRGA